MNTPGNQAAQAGRADAGLYDLLVIGGGINGAGVARDAAGRGLSVALCEQHDFAGATSSASTKLIHGGLRYLEYYEFRLVAEALSERERLLDIAPHIAWPLRFVMPHVDGLRPRWMIRLGLWLYDHIGGRITLPKSRAVRLDRMAHASGLLPAITRGFAYSDAWVDDARLVILNLLSAQEHGADILPRTRLADARRVENQDGGDNHWLCTLEDVSSGEHRSVKARAVVNTAGPWVAQMDHQLNADDGETARHAAVKLVRGSHIVVPRLFDGEHAYILQNDDKRIVFMIPYEERYTLIGTTDVPQENMNHGARISAEEEAYLLRAVNRYLARPISAADIAWRYAGVRPLFDDESDNPSAVTRDYTLVLQERRGLPCVSVYGGKITTYRRLAESVLDKLAPWMQDRSRRAGWSATEALPGAGFRRADRQREVTRLQTRYAGLDAHFLARLFSRHGLNCRQILRAAQSMAELGRDFGGGLTQREVEYLVEHEWAREADDVLWRRTKCGLHMSEAQRAEFGAWFRGWFAAYRAGRPAPGRRLRTGLTRPGADAQVSRRW
ncbi:glycerol-3-phosphate dehydrogenase [Herbaspirillum sp. LeCh32-8]|uniref:glycerol-3-phosphate dehydrogenase n=1 Tax=Herbaspirillum sp. LeCh32-8 TaxID=2821356 RepID=UPI001AEB9365|nr:glycerol-3-phosphate dehydrogenase [Herbaspirillum sp. LeCh32-8]MBP0596650.1 glycerol-3-phosphate dehydrogenase [Herbaspirillum sp. LeCh32-8]